MRFITVGLVLGVLFSPVALAGDFAFQDVVKKARALAEKDYTPPAAIPKFLRNLTYTQYQGIRFKPDLSLWRNESRFHVMLMSPGHYYSHAVKINLVDSKGVHPVDFQKRYFSFSPEDRDLVKRIPPDLGYAGFKLTYPFRKADSQNQFLVFAGASYFRGVGRDDAFGVSARGIAVNTGLPSGEQFPSFVEYWLVHPPAHAHSMTFYALLDGKRLTGAYAFRVHPGPVTRLQVTATLFPRHAVELLGLAPLTSMFYFGENTPRPPYEWRSQVHDSDGLLIHDGASGEWLWRPLINPQKLQMDYFETGRIDGYGLLQRQRDFSDYEDLGDRYDVRPSTWVKARGDWGKGRVVLVQLPTETEMSDNIVAFWAPPKDAPAHKPLTVSYDIDFGPPSVAGEPLGYALHTFVGDGSVIGGGDVEGAYRVLVDFQGGALARLKGEAPVKAVVTPQDGGKVLEQFVQYMAPRHQWRLSILARPKSGKALTLRAFLKEHDHTLTETWTYRLPPDNQIIKQD